MSSTGSEGSGGDSLDGYEQPTPSQDPTAGLKKEARAAVEGLTRGLRPRGPTGEINARVALAAILDDSPVAEPNEALDATIPSKAFRLRIQPALRALVHLHGKAAGSPAAVALASLHIRQLEAYVGIGFKSKEERAAEKNAVANIPALPHRYEKSDFDEPAEWQELGHSGYCSSNLSPRLAPTSSSESLMSSPSGSPSKEDEGGLQLVSKDRIKGLHKKYTKLKKIQEMAAAAARKKKKKRIVRKPHKVISVPSEGLPAGDDTPKSVYGQPSLEGLNDFPAPTRPPKDPVARPAAHPTPTKENCYARISDPADPIPPDAFGRVVESEAGLATPTFVGLYYKNGEAVFGRVWREHPAGLTASFVVGGHEIRGLVGSAALPGSIDLLCYPSAKPEAKAKPEVVMGFAYAWLPPDAVKASSTWRPLSVMRSVPALFTHPPSLGSFSISDETASLAWKGKVQSITRPNPTRLRILARRDL